MRQCALNLGPTLHSPYSCSRRIRSNRLRLHSVVAPNFREDRSGRPSREGRILSASWDQVRQLNPGRKINLAGDLKTPIKSPQPEYLPVCESCWPLRPETARTATHSAVPACGSTALGEWENNFGKQHYQHEGLYEDK